MPPVRASEVSDLSEGPGRIDRTKDLYRVHDSSKKQKKERKSGDEKEFMEESERDIEEFREDKQKQEPKPQIPTKSLLNKLSESAPPIFEIIDESGAEGKGEK